jgi:serine/threonine protein kinase
MLEIRVGGKYRLGKNNEEVAIKLENVSTRHPQLSYESKLMKLMQESAGVPAMLWFGSEGGFNVLIMELLGPSIEDLFLYCNKKFSLKTVMMVGSQMLERIEYLHNKNFLHRDVKPDNFLIGLGRKSKIIHMIDFGLAKKYRDPRSFSHIPYKEGKSLTGTARYASINTHEGLEQSRRDDLESLFYVLAYLLLGHVPWQGVEAATKQEKYGKIMEKKKNATIDHTYQDLPREMLMFFTYCRSLKFEEKPDYAYLKSLFCDVMDREGYVCDFIFDWTILNYSTHKQLRNKLLDDLRKNNAMNESKIALNESNVLPTVAAPAAQKMVQMQPKEQKKCVIF